ncbi:YjgN family protein [Vibrio sp. AK197]
MDNKQHINPLIFKGQGGAFFGIWIVNILLSIVTLGIYSAWAKVRTKRYFYGNTQLAGDVFEYHAKPLQILKGRLVALLCLLVWALLGQFNPVVSLVLILAFYVAIPWLLWSNARFDSAMTSFRNVHFSFAGELSKAYAVILGRALGALVILAVYCALVAGAFHASFGFGLVMAIGALILMAVLYSWVVFGITQYFVNGYRYGDWAFSAQLKQSVFVKIYLSAMGFGVLAFIALTVVMLASSFSGVDFNGSAQDMFATIGSNSVITVVGMYLGFILITLTLTAYTVTRVRNYLFSVMVLSQEEHDQLKLTFISKFKVSSFIWLMLSNFLLQLVTLGLARPWAMVRASRYVADNTRVVGDMALLVSRDQDSDVDSAVSDEVAQAFDLNLGIG